MHEALTPKQRQVLDAIRQFQQEKGYPPTVRELAEHFGQVSAAGIHKILMTLQEKGVLSRRESGKSRSYHIIGEEPNAGYSPRARACPIIGEVVAGMPELALEEREGDLYLDSDWVGKEDIFLLKVRGHSMIDADIRDGDLLAVQMTQSCRNGDIIIALLDEEATVKRFFREKDRVRLQPENQTMQPIYIPIDDPGFRIIGKVKGLLRRYH
ncbi:MAG TPA: transcriptional repressor LexA [bacterium]|nr:transcriptional repressor LexA [bacterium]HPR89649.1 transcriptional repressor LexA [bacterium]